MILALVSVTVVCIVAALRPREAVGPTVTTATEVIRAEADTEKPTETASTEKPTETASTEKPTETASTEKPTETASTEKPTETASTEKPTETASTEKPTETASTEKPTETASTEKPTETASTEKTTQTASVDKDAETVTEILTGVLSGGGDLLPGEFEISASGATPGGNWLFKKGNSYFLGTDGQPLKKQFISWRANEYYLDEKGCLVGAQKRIIEGRLYEADKSGILSLQKGWMAINGSRYYGTSEGTVVRDKKIEDGGKSYYLDPTGALATGQTLKYEDKLYQADKDGALTPATGWVQIGDDWYFGEAGGTIAKSRQISRDNKVCYVGEDGRIVTSDFYMYNDQLFFAEEDGNIRRTEGWFHWKNRWYYSVSDGSFVHDDYITVDKEKYYMDSTGARIVGKPTIDMYLKCPGIYDWMISHHNDYYFKTNYTSLRYHSGHPEELIRPYGEYGEDSAMNCTGFISSLVYYSGGDLDRVAAMGRYGGYGNGDNYLTLATRGYIRYEVFRSANDLLKSGKAHKGDIMYLAPVWRSGADCHMGVFWGDTSSENALWSQTLKTKCTVTKIYMVDPVNQIYYFPISRNSVIEYYDGDTP